LEASDRVAPINLLGKTFLKQVTVLVNGKQGFDSGDLYGYRTYLETELNYGSDAKGTILEAAGYAKDTPSESINTINNTGWAKREQLYKNGQVELMAPLHCDLFISDRLMVSNTELTVEIHRNSDKFLLMALTQGTGTDPAPTYKLQIDDMKWYIRKLQVMDSIHLSLESVLNRTPAKYPLRRISMTNHFVAAGRQSVPATPIFNGQLPRRLVIGFVKENAFFGDFGLSPFEFGNNHVRSIQIEAGGQLFPRSPLKTNFSTNQYTRAYVQMLEGLGFADENKGNHINMKEYKNSSCLFVFDLTPEETDASHWQLLREGAVVVHCDFQKAVEGQGLEMIIYGEFDNLALIDRTRTIHYDYSV
jgi:hypothetical protein